ncbi:carbohydrate kinase family protein [Hyphomicrobium sp. CS1GBMeth3]|uniref:carbohydrate kinase family protein n=1 Tax=Hyphomicrobium sp. CS1GBMeth3 TaxID=1892845 RepID=UPI0009FB7CEB|nr:carbohydrate kinase family protein [Hyphomicrobium sp. CS1GBMeth3]
MSAAPKSVPRDLSRSEGHDAPLKVLTIGGAMIDTIAIIASSAIERMTLLNADSSFLLLEEGRKTEALEVSTHCGGGAVNAAVAFARLGLDCSALIKLGQDRRAEQVIACLEAEGISGRWVIRDARAPTGSSVLVSSHERNAAVFTFRGANTLLAADDLVDGAFNVDLVHIANLSNQAAHCYPLIIEKANAGGARVSTNPGIRQLHGHGGAFRASFPSLDILSLNRREADEVVGLIETNAGIGDRDRLDFPTDISVPPLAERGLRFESRRMSVRAFCRALMGRGVGCVVLTDGRDGAFAATEGRLFYCSTQETHVAGTAGAGDAFVATFAAYVSEGNAPDTALKAATINASAVLGYVDTQTGLLRRSDLEAHLARKIETPNVIEWPL